MKIDIFCHIFPQSFFDRMLKLPESGIKKRSIEVPAMVDLDIRFRMMDRFGDYVQVVCLASPPMEALGDANHSPELAQIGNDGLAELVVSRAADVPNMRPPILAAKLSPVPLIAFHWSDSQYRNDR